MVLTFVVQRAPRARDSPSISLLVPSLRRLLLDPRAPTHSVLLGRRSSNGDPSPLPRLLVVAERSRRRSDKALVGLEVVGVDLLVGLLDRRGGGGIKVAVVLVVVVVRVVVPAL